MRITSVTLLSFVLIACTPTREEEPFPPCFDCCDDGFSDCHPPPFEVIPSRSLPPLASADVPPPPLSGGTLLVTGDRAIVADADGDAVHLVSLGDEDLGVLTTTLFAAGDEPGRVIADDSGMIYVVLRGGNAVAQLDASLAVTARYAVCSSPRGVASFGTSLYVACLEGDLVTFDTTTGAEIARQYLGEDLRDVVVAGDHVYVSHFRSATVSVFPREGGPVTELFIAAQTDRFSRSLLLPSVAYRMIAFGDTVLILHQLSRASEPVRISVSGGYGGVDCTPGLVQAGLTVIEDSSITSVSALGNLVLPVDLAVDGASGSLRIAAAGSRTDDPTFGGSGDSFGATPIIRAPAVAMSDLASVQGSPSVPLGCSPGVQYDDGRRATAVGFTGDGRAVVLTRAPTALHIVDSDVYVELPGDDVYDVGHELFFGDTGAGIACASCHAEGGDDGLVWEFEGIGRRRTQELRGGILGTEPFHWDGDMADFRHLAREVFSTRMLGPELPDDYADALATYIDGMPVPAHGDHVDALAAERGRVIFESAEAQCSLCHGGPRLSTPGSFDVGTGGAFQVPSLVGVSLRAPFLHTGCAETLEERFSPDCGGATHGNVSGLTPEELADLIAYLESV